MTERGMIFNSEMVRAILDGRKTQTRRIIKDCTVGRDPISKFIQVGKKFIGCYPEDVPELIRECCPYGVPGDRIWVRETFQGPLFDFEQMEAYQEDSSKFKNQNFVSTKLMESQLLSFLTLTTICIVAGARQSTCRAGHPASRWRLPAFGSSS